MRALVLGLVLLSLLWGAVPSVAAQDLNASLNSAEVEVPAAESEIEEAETGLPSAEADYQAHAMKARPVDRAAATAHARVARLQSQLASQQREAAAKVTAIEAKRQDESDEQSQQVKRGIAFGIAALVAAALALAWGWFRASAAVAALTEIKLEQALGVCIGGGFLLLVIGAAIGGIIGSLILLLAIVFCVSLLMARHSAEIQRGKAKAITGRERFPSWSGPALAAVMGILALFGFGGAIFASGPAVEPASAELIKRAHGEEGKAAESQLADLEAAEERLQAKAAKLDAVREAAAERLATVRSNVSDAKDRLARAESRVRHLSDRLVALTEREERQEQKAIEETERQEEREREEIEETEAEECDPNYSGCLDPNAIDYDCEGGSGDGPLYTGTVEVLGVDHYGLDDDGDGIGCDP